MNKLSILSLLTSVAAIILVLATRAPQEPSQSKSETSYEHVMRTQTLRCGYGTWAPGVFKDPASGQMAGLFVELIEAIGKLNGLKIEWTTEVDWGQIAQAIDAGKVDAFCAGMANDAARGKQLAYTMPLSYWTFDVIVRADDPRFANAVIRGEDLNKSDYTAAYSEGDVLETIIKSEFPKVQGLPLPPLGSPADNIMNVISKKTDFVVFPKVMFQAFEKSYPGKLRYLKAEPSLRAYGNVIAVSINDLRLQQLLNAGIQELVNSGTYAQIMDRYDQSYPGSFLKIQPSYTQAH